MSKTAQIYDKYRVRMSWEYCMEFLDNPLRNPLTGRAIKEGRDTQKALHQIVQDVMDNRTQTKESEETKESEATPQTKEESKETSFEKKQDQWSDGDTTREQESSQKKDHIDKWLQKLSLNKEYDQFSFHQWKPLRHIHPQWKEAQTLHVQECGGGGDCMFHSIGHALALPMQNIRDMTAAMVNEHNVTDLLVYYRDVYRVGGSWHPEKLLRLSVPKQVEAMRQVIQNRGNAYQGDTDALQLLSSHPYGLGFLVISTNMPHQPLYPQFFVNRLTTRVVILLQIGGHWQLIGEQERDKVATTFPVFDLPAEVTHKMEEFYPHHQISDLLREEPHILLEEKKTT